jgi:uncharacterized protein YndB with AHSA1/START domain
MHNNVIIKQRVNATVEKVWKALTDQAQMKEWYFDIPDFETDLHTEFSFYGSDGETKQQHHGEILEVIPQEKLKYSWSYPEISKEKTIVKWNLQKEAETTLVILTHKGLENLEHLGEGFKKENFEKIWTKIVSEKLKNFVEK